MRKRIKLHSGVKRKRLYWISRELIWMSFILVGAQFRLSILRVNELHYYTEYTYASDTSKNTDDRVGWHPHYGLKVLESSRLEIMTHSVPCMLCVLQKTIGNTNITLTFTTSSSGCITLYTTNSSTEYFAMPSEHWSRHFAATGMRVLMIS